MSRFTELCGKWRHWSESADKSEGGWESDFPDWRLLMEEASRVMMQGTITSEELTNLQLCWKISAEDEVLCDFAKEHVEECWFTLEALSASEIPEVRWQVYSAAGSRGKAAGDILRRGLGDPDTYARRRAILALSAIRPTDADILAAEAAKDPDPYVRQAAIDLIRSAEDSEVKRAVVNALLNDPVDHVRRAARDTIRPI